MSSIVFGRSGSYGDSLLYPCTRRAQSRCACRPRERRPRQPCRLPTIATESTYDDACSCTGRAPACRFDLCAPSSQRGSRATFRSSTGANTSAWRTPHRTHRWFRWRSPPVCYSTATLKLLENTGAVSQSRRHAAGARISLRFARRPSIANGPEPPKTRAARQAR